MSSPSTLDRVNRPGVVRRLAVVFAALLLVAISCTSGSDDSVASAGRALDPELSAAAIRAASTNESQLELTNRVTTSELLDTADGSIRSLPEVVTGDRAVLVWYWAPH